MNGRAEQRSMILSSAENLPPRDSWRILSSSGLEFTGSGIQLARLPAAPVPLKDATGQFGGIENPTGVAVAPDGTIYVADGATHRIYSLTRRDGQVASATYFTTSDGDRYAFVRAATRLERWPRGRTPKGFDEVEVVNDRVWSRQDARRLLTRPACDQETTCDKPPIRTPKACGCSPGGSGIRVGSEAAPAPSLVTDVAELLRETLEREQALTSPTGVQLVAQICQKLPSVGGRRGLLGEAVRRMLRVALLLVGAGPAQVLLRAREQGARLIIQVGAAGEGLEPAPLDRIWDAVRRVDSLGKGPGGGLSLRGIVEQSDGTFAAGTEAGAMAVFTMDLPLAPAGAGVPRDCSCKPAADTPAPLLITEEFDDEYPAALPAGAICKSTIDFVPCVGGEGAEPRRLRSPRGLAFSADGSLFVVDSGNKRVQIFGRPGMLLRAVWSGFTDPFDVAVDSKGNAWISDRGPGRLRRFDCRGRRCADVDGTALLAHVFRARYGPDAGERFVFIPARERLENWPRALGADPANPGQTAVVSLDVRTVEHARQLLLARLHARGAVDLFQESEIAYPLEAGAPVQEPSHLAIDGSDRLYVVDDHASYVRMFDAQGRLIRELETRDELNAPFAVAALAVGPSGKLYLAGGDTLHEIDLAGGTLAPRRAAAVPPGCRGLGVDAADRIFAVGPGVVELSSTRGFVATGELIAGPFDSGVDHCSWDRVHLDFTGPIPGGTAITATLHTSDADDAEVQNFTTDQWHGRQVNAPEFLVLGPPGRFLWLRLAFEGDGSSSPVLRRVRLFFPRDSLLQYLPAVYQSDPVSRDFLDRFLAIFQRIFGSLESKVTGFADYLDPDGVPAEFIEWLGSWLHFAFQPEWSIETRRALLRNAPAIYRKRGTSQGMRHMLEIVTEGRVRIREHYRSRGWTFLNATALAGGRTRLWGDCVAPRFRLDANSRIGDFHLGSTDDPLRDPFHVFAHQFTVYVPRSVVRTELQERRLRALIEKERPAHAACELRVVDERLRLGRQATLGLDAVVGHVPATALCDCGHLGIDSVLGGAPEERPVAALSLGGRKRLGRYSPHEHHRPAPARLGPHGRRHV